MITTPQACSSGDHDDDLMTPPNVLLERALKEAERYTTEDDKVQNHILLHWLVQMYNIYIKHSLHTPG